MFLIQQLFHFSSHFESPSGEAPRQVRGTGDFEKFGLGDCVQNMTNTVQISYLCIFVPMPFQDRLKTLISEVWDGVWVRLVTLWTSSSRSAGRFFGNVFAVEFLLEIGC